MFNKYKIRMLEFVPAKSLQLFKQFLIDNDAFDKFSANCYIREDMDISSPRELVANGFRWDKSSEGLGFWLCLSLKWEEYYESRR